MTVVLENVLLNTVEDIVMGREIIEQDPIWMSCKGDTRYGRPCVNIILVAALVTLESGYVPIL